MEVNKVFSAIFIFVVTLILTFVFVVPKYQQSSDSQKALAQKQAEYEGKLMYYSKIADLIKNIESKQDALAKVNNALPQDFSYAQVVYFLQQKGTEAGLIVKSLTFSPSSGASAGQQNVKDVVVTANVSGNYQGLKNFISSLETSSRLFGVTSISFTAPAGSASSANAGQAPNQENIYDFAVVIKTNTY